MHAKISPRSVGRIRFLKNFLQRKEDEMGDKGKRDKGKREDQKKGKHTLKEKRKQKKEKK